MQEHKEIIIDYRIILAVLLAVVLIFLGLRLVRSSSEVGATVRENKVLPAAVETAPGMSASAGGVDIVVEDVQRAGGKTLVAVNMNNHRYDLSDPDITGRTTLSGVKAERFDPLSDQVGGHHVSGEFWFDGELEGTLAIGITEDLTLEIELL